MTEDEMLNKATADVLEGARSKARLTQPRLAAAAGMSSVTVQKLLSGNQSVKLAQFVKLAKASKADPSDLLEEVAVEVEKMSAASTTTDALATLRLQKEAAKMSLAEIEKIAIAADSDKDIRNPEPEAP